MDRFTAILSAIPFNQFQEVFRSVNITPESYSVIMGVTAVLISLIAFARAGARSPNGFSNIDTFQARLDKIELILSESRNKQANALSHLEMEIKASQHDIAEARKIMDIVFSRKASNSGVATDYNDYHQTPNPERLSVNMRGAPINVRVSQGQQEADFSGIGYKK